MLYNQKIMSNENASTKTPLSVVKFLELVSLLRSLQQMIDSDVFQSLAVVCCYFHFYSFSDDDLVTEFLATGTFCGYCIILTAVMAGCNFKLNSIYLKTC